MKSLKYFDDMIDRRSENTLIPDEFDEVDDDIVVDMGGKQNKIRHIRCEGSWLELDRSLNLVCGL